jgi:hypothetical protein
MKADEQENLAIGMAPGHMKVLGRHLFLAPPPLMPQPSHINAPPGTNIHATLQLNAESGKSSVMLGENLYPRTTSGPWEPAQGRHNGYTGSQGAPPLWEPVAPIAPRPLYSLQHHL